VTRRPHSVTVVAWIYLVAGAIGLAYHATGFDLARPLADDALWILLVRLLAVVAGVFLLRRQNWARWLAVFWMAWHVGLSIFHPVSELVIHSVLLAAFVFILFRPPAAAWFRTAKAGATPDA
jgi:hypothetical protein